MYRYFFFFFPLERTTFHLRITSHSQRASVVRAVCDVAVITLLYFLYTHFFTLASSERAPRNAQNAGPDDASKRVNRTRIVQQHSAGVLTKHNIRNNNVIILLCVIRVCIANLKTHTHTHDEIVDKPLTIMRCVYTVQRRRPVEMAFRLIMYVLRVVGTHEFVGTEIQRERE